MRPIAANDDAIALLQHSHPHPSASQGPNLANSPIDHTTEMSGNRKIAEDVDFSIAQFPA